MTISESSTAARALPARPVAAARPSSRPRLARAVQLGLAGAAVASAVLGAWWFDSDPSLWTLEGTWLVRELVPWVIAFAVGGVVLLRFREATIVGWVMLGSALANGLSVLCAGLFYQSYLHVWENPGLFFALSSLCSGLSYIVAVVVLPQVFPDGLLRGVGWRVLLALSVSAHLAGQGIGLWNNLQSVYDPDNWDLYWMAWTAPYVFVGSAVVVFATLVVRIWRSSGLRRRQVLMFTLAWVISQGAQELVYRRFGDSDVLPYLYVAWAPMLIAVIAVAVVRYQLFDIRLIVRRAAVYAVMVLALTTAFAAVYALVLYVLASQVIDQRYRWVAVMIALAVVLAADPLRRRLRTRLEQRLLGTRSDPMSALGRLDAEVMTGASDEGVVYGRVARIVADAVRSPSVAVAVHHGAEIDVVAQTAAPVRSGEAYLVPLVHRGERIGELRVAGRTPGEGYGRADRALLGRLGSQAATLAYELRRDREIDTLRRDAIEAMAEQRMILGRDLHDGIAPLLAGAGLTADALRRGMPEGSADADEAGRLATRLRNAAGEVRRIAHDLQPTGGDGGLGGLIGDYVSSLSGPRVPRFDVDVSGLDDTVLPATVELALSRVVLEAVNNVVRHARATSATISVRRQAGMIVLLVADDGSGLAQPYVSGLGVTSMRSRVEALGGSFDLTAVDGGGTRLEARVPVSA